MKVLSTVLLLAILGGFIITLGSDLLLGENAPFLALPLSLALGLSARKIAEKVCGISLKDDLKGNSK